MQKVRKKKAQKPMKTIETIQASESSFYHIWGYLAYHKYNPQKDVGAYCIGVNTALLDEDDLEDLYAFLRRVGACRPGRNIEGNIVPF